MRQVLAQRLLYLHCRLGMLAPRLPSWQCGMYVWVRKLQVKLLLERHPSLFGIRIEHAGKITRLLTAEGLTSEELHALINQHPNILKQRCAPCPT